MLTMAFDLLESGDEDTCQEILVSLVCYQNKSLESCIPTLMERGIYYPGILFKDASARSRGESLQQVEQDKDNRNHLSLALAWIGDDQVVHHFKNGGPCLHHGRRNYTSRLKLMRMRGWELTEKGSKRRLFYHDSYAIAKIVPSESNYAENLNPLNFEGEFRSLSMVRKRSDHLDGSGHQSTEASFLGVDRREARVCTCVKCAVTIRSIWMWISTENPNGAKLILNRNIYRSLIPRRMIEAMRRRGSPYGLRTILATAIMRPIGRSVRRFRKSAATRLGYRTPYIRPAPAVPKA